MSNLTTYILISSLAGTALLLLYRNRKLKRWPNLLIGLLAIIGVTIFLHVSFAFPLIIETKSAIAEGLVIGLSYVCMLIGMAAKSLYTELEQGRKKLKFDLVSFLMPALVSPIVFISILNLMENAYSGGLFTRSKAVIFFVAFQNGFFWKDVVGKAASETNTNTSPGNK